MTEHEREALAYAMRRQRAKRQREVMLFGRVKRIEDLRTGECSKILTLHFPQKNASLDNGASG